MNRPDLLISVVPRRWQLEPLRVPVNQLMLCQARLISVSPLTHPHGSCHNSKSSPPASSPSLPRRPVSAPTACNSQGEALPTGPVAQIIRHRFRVRGCADGGPLPLLGVSDAAASARHALDLAAGRRTPVLVIAEPGCRPKTDRGIAARPHAPRAHRSSPSTAGPPGRRTWTAGCSGPSPGARRRVISNRSAPTRRS